MYRLKLINILHSARYYSNRTLPFDAGKPHLFSVFGVDLLCSLLLFKKKRIVTGAFSKIIT